MRENIEIFIIGAILALGLAFNFGLDVISYHIHKCQVKEIIREMVKPEALK